MEESEGYQKSGPTKGYRSHGKGLMYDARRDPEDFRVKESGPKALVVATDDFSKADEKLSKDISGETGNDLSLEGREETHLVEEGGVEGNGVVNNELDTEEMMNSDLLGDDLGEDFELGEGNPLLEDLLGDNLFGEGATDFSYSEELPVEDNIVVENQEEDREENREEILEDGGRVGTRRRLFQKTALLNGISSKKRNALTLASPRKLIRGGATGLRTKEGNGKQGGEKPPVLKADG